MQPRRSWRTLALVVALGSVFFLYWTRSATDEPAGGARGAVSAALGEASARRPSGGGGQGGFGVCHRRDGDAGVVDRVEVKDGTSMQDPEFTLCIRESMYTTMFGAPPAGASETTVEYPLELSP